MKTLYEKVIEEIEDIYSKSLLTAKVTRHDIERLERAQKLAAEHFTDSRVSCLIHSHYRDVTHYPVSLRVQVWGGTDDDLLRLMLDMRSELFPAESADPTTAVLVELVPGDTHTDINMFGRTGNKFSITLNSREFPPEWLHPIVDRFLEITRQNQAPLFIGVDLAKSEGTEVAA